MKYSDILRTIFNHEAIIVMVKGDWKTGKTNLGLRIVEDLLKLKIIKIAGTNIEIEETDTILKITDFPTLREFHFDNPRNPTHKAFVFDEAGKLTSRRGAMSKRNRAWYEFIPELSKGRCRLIVITQSEYIADSIFTDSQFTKAIFTTYKRKTYYASVESELFRRIVNRTQSIRPFPKCEIVYNPYGSAQWFLERQEIRETGLLCCYVARLYGVENISTVKIKAKLGLPSRTQVTRLLKLHIKHTFKEFTKSDINELKEIRKSIEP